jgi:hypothetical protein
VPSDLTKHPQTTARQLFDGVLNVNHGPVGVPRKLSAAENLPDRPNSIGTLRVNAIYVPIAIFILCWHARSVGQSQTEHYASRVACFDRCIERRK